MKRIVGLILFAAMTVGAAQAGDWPIFGHDAAHSGVADELVEPPLELLWKYSGSFSSSATVSGGVVYAGSLDYNVYALDAKTGSLRWKYQTGNGVWSSPAVSGGVVYVGSRDKNVYALDAVTGALIWKYTTGDVVDSSPTVAGDVVYVGSHDGSVYALDAASGSLKWKYTIGYPVGTSPAVSIGLIYVGSYDGVYALDAINGAFRWKYKTDGLVVDSSPAISGSLVYVGSRDKNVYALDAVTGALIWKYTTGSWVDSSPAVSGSAIYVGSWDKNVYALDAVTGTLIWKFLTEGSVWSSPAVSGSLVYITGPYDHNMYAIDATTGNPKWIYATEGYSGRFSTISDSVVYVESNGNLYAFKPSKVATSEGTLTTTSASSVNKGSTIPTEALLPETSESQDNFNLMRMNLILIILVILFSGMVAWLFLKLRERPHPSTAKVDKGLINETINAETMLKPESKAVDEVSLTSAPKIELKPESTPEKHGKGAEIKTAFGYKRAALLIILLILVGAIGYTIYQKYAPLTELSNCGNNCIDYKKVKLPQYETSVPDIKITEADAEKLIMDIPIIIYNPSMKDTETVKIDFDVFMERKHLTKGTIPANQLPAKQNTTILIKDVVIKYEELGDVLQKLAERHGAEMVGGGRANISMTIDLLIYFPIDVFSINIHTFTIPIQIETEVPVDMLKQNEEAKKQIEEKVKEAIKEVQDKEKLPFTVPTEIPTITVPALTSTIQGLPTSTPTQPLPAPSMPQFP